MSVWVSEDERSVKAEGVDSDDNGGVKAVVVGDGERCGDGGGGSTASASSRRRRLRVKGGPECSVVGI